MAVSLEMLQAMVQRVLDNQAQQSQDLLDIKHRLSALEHGQANLIKLQGGQSEVEAHIQLQVDRLAERLARVERRLDLNDA